MHTPPSGFTQAEYWNAIKAGARTHIRLNFNSQGITIVDEDIDVSYGVVLEDILNGDIDLTFGKAVMKRLSTKILLSSKTQNLNWTEPFMFQFGIDVDGTTKWRTIDQFYGERPNNVTTVSTVDFVAYDSMKLFDKLASGLFASLTYPVTLDDIMTALCEMAFGGSGHWLGFTDLNIPYIFYNKTFESAPFDDSGYTCREILAWIAEACGRYASVKNTIVYLKWFTDKTDYVVSANEEFSVDHADLENAEDYSIIESIKIKQENLGFDIDYPSASSKNVYMIIDNPFLYIADVQQDTINYVKPLFDKLANFDPYVPTRIECVGSWLIESGDIITVQLENNLVSMPIFYHVSRWNGTVTDTIEVTGRKERVSVTSANKQKIFNDRQIRLYATDKFYEKQSGIDIDPDGVDIYGEKYLRITSGGTFDVESQNFEVSSENGYIRSNNWKFDNSGLTYHGVSDGNPFRIGKFSEREQYTSGLFYNFPSNTQFPVLELIAGGSSNGTNHEQILGFSSSPGSSGGSGIQTTPHGAVFPRFSSHIVLGGSGYAVFESIGVKEIFGGYTIGDLYSGDTLKIHPCNNSSDYPHYNASFDINRRNMDGANGLRVLTIRSGGNGYTLVMDGDIKPKQVMGSTINAFQNGLLSQFSTMDSPQIRFLTCQCTDSGQNPTNGKWALAILVKSTSSIYNVYIPDTLCQGHYENSTWSWEYDISKYNAGSSCSFQQVFVGKATNAKDGYYGSIVLDKKVASGVTVTLRAGFTNYGTWYSDGASHTITTSNAIVSDQVLGNTVFFRIPASNISSASTLAWIRLAGTIDFS